MTHLTEEELVDLADGVLPDERHAHLRLCGACREQAESIGTLLTRVAEVDVPEPSPLFWDHLSRRVSEAVAEPMRREKPWLGWLGRPASAWAAGLTSMALVAALSFAARPGPRHDAAPAAGAPAAAQHGEAPGAEPEDLDADEAWALVRSLADEVGWDEAHAMGLSAGPEATERMALELSSREQTELARLIQAELKRPGA